MVAWLPGCEDVFGGGRVAALDPDTMLGTAGQAGKHSVARNGGHRSLAPTPGPARPSPATCPQPGEQAAGEGLLGAQAGGEGAGKAS